MAGNVIASGVILDVTDLKVTGDASPQAGAASEVTVDFKFTEPFYSTFFKPLSWPYTVKIMVEGYGQHARELIIPKSGTCTQASPNYVEKVPITLDREGVYKLSALVELDNNAGFVMGYSEKDVQLTVWTAV